jgi:uncharacterized protein (TIGR02145 family)
LYFKNEDKGPLIIMLNESETVADIDGNVYHTVKIGTQVWMEDNLRTTHYNDGTDIPNVTNSTEWAILSTGAYCWYNNDKTFKNPYGALYNWYTVNTGKLAPKGWHVSTWDDWNTLVTYLGGENVAGGKLKETGTTHWNSPNTGATNETKFTALPAGVFHPEISFASIMKSTSWWSTLEAIPNDISGSVTISYDNSAIILGTLNQHFGVSVRCLKN